jgi:tRNA threonylcarbamoyladenosine biosynthesis protein TsaE
VTPAVEVTTGSEEETEALAARLASGLVGGEVLLLEGELGAGKTAFVRGLARGLGAREDDVASPTFVLLTSYAGRLRLHHADLYRLRGDGDADDIGLLDLPGPDGVLAIEWAERLRERPWERVISVRLSHEGGDRRHLVIGGVGA